MSATITADPSASVAPSDGGAFARRALARLGVIELWERFSYYSLMVLLPLFLTAPAASDGFGWDGGQALRFFGLYMAALTIAPFFGGLVSDRWLGSRRALFLGAWAMLAGHLLLAVPHLLGLSGRAALGPFYAALGLVVLGNGLFKPNISVMVGRLPHADAAARDAAFGSFWLYINIGGLLAGLVAGTLAQAFGWHWGFGAAALGMALAIVLMMVFAPRYITPFATPPAAASGGAGYAGVDWRFVIPTGAVLGFAILFGIAYFQTQGAVSLFTEARVDREIFGFTVPTPWFMSLNPFYMMLVMPLLAHGWRTGRGIGARWPTSGKMAAGFVLIACSFALTLGAIVQAGDGGLASPLWIAGAILLLTCAELMVGPIALAAVSRLAPPAAANLSMGAFSAATGIGGLLSGAVGALAVEQGYLPVFGMILALALAAAAALVGARRWFARYGC